MFANVHVKDSRHGTPSAQPLAACRDSCRPWICSLPSWCLGNFTWIAFSLRFSNIYQCEYPRFCWWVPPLGSGHYLDVADRNLGWRVNPGASRPLDEARWQFHFIASRNNWSKALLFTIHGNRLSSRPSANRRLLTSGRATSTCHCPGSR